MVERLVAVARAEELLLPRARAHGAVGRVHGELGARRHQTEQLPEELRRVGRARAVQHLHAHYRLLLLDLSLHPVAIPLAVLATLAREHVHARAHLDLSVARQLDRERRVAGGHRQGRQRVRAEGLHRRGQLDEENELDERHQQRRRLRVHTAQVLLEVEVRDHRDRPRLGAAEVVQVDPRPVGRRSRQVVRRGERHRGRRADVRRLGGQVLAVLVAQRHLREPVLVPVPRVDVADRACGGA
eukprot:scaffold6985_cov57-Phaeocystis_antarctica.AAC.4